MTQQLLNPADHDRPTLIVPIASLAFAFACALLVSGTLAFAGRMSMSLGVQLLGSGLETMGPVPYFLYAGALVLAAWGLIKRKNWGRRLLIAICAVGILLLVPHISSAVIDQRWLAMCSDGVQILVRIAIASYLWREAEWFAK